MPPVKIKCLVCNEIVRGTSGKDVFQKGELGLQPLKERLQVVLQVNLDRKSSHSTFLCSSCVKQLDKIDDYQCNIEAFSDTFRDAVESRQALEKENEDSDEAEKARLCFVCNGGITGSDGNGVVVGSDDQPSNSLKTRLERTLSVSLEKEIATLGRSMELCGQCTDTLGRIEKELKVVTDFASTYRSTRVLYDDDIDQDIAEAIEEDDNDEEEVNTSTGMEEVDDYDEDMDERWAYGGRPKRKGKPRALPIPGIIFSDEGFLEAEKYLDRTGRQPRCKVCNYSIQGLCHVRTHVRRHLGLKPYSCEYCGFAFADRSNCIKHVRRCTGHEKPKKGHSQLAQMATGRDDSDQAPTRGVTGNAVDFTKNPGTDAQRMERNPNSGDVVELNSGETEGEYGCSKCTASFHTVKAANAHMKLHKQRKYSTADSSASDSGVSSKGNITENTSPGTSSQHSSTTRIPDSTQDSRFTTRPLEKRRRIDGQNLQCQSDDLVEHVSGKDYICTACNYTATYRRVLAHARTHTGEKPYQCHFCNRAYVDNSSYIRHMKEHRGEGGSSNAGPKSTTAAADVVLDGSSGGSDGEQESVSLSKNPKPFECSLCNETFNDPAHLTEHIRSHIEETDKQVGIQKRMQNPSVPLHASFPGDREQQPVLPTPSSGPHQSIHIKTEPLAENYTAEPFNHSINQTSMHHSQIPYDNRNASYYQRQSSSSVDLDFDRNGTVNDTDAMAEAYSNMSGAPLANQLDDNSDPTAVTQEFRDSHIRWDDAGSVYRCVKCPYENPTLYNIQKHIRIHTGEKPYKCEFCTRRFSDKSNRIKHIRKHHQQEPGPKPHKVPRPNNVFTDKVEVKSQPLPDAKPFKCDVCKVSFRYESTLNKHQELHIENQIFVCPICSSKFSCLIDLQKHKATVHPPKTDVHTLPELPKKVSPFKCPTCGVVFALSVELDRHYAKEHSGRPDVHQTSNRVPVVNNHLQYQPSQGIPQQRDDRSPTDLWTSEPSPVAFRSSIEQLDNGIYRCILCCKKESPHLIDVLEHQRNKHDDSELATYERMVNSGKISLIVDIPGGHRCKICPFKSSLLSKMHHHIKWQHYVNHCNATADADLLEDNIDQFLIMKKHPQSFYFECLYCHVRHKAPKMLTKHVKNKHPQEYLAALKKSEQNGSAVKSPNNVARSDTRQAEVANPAASTQQQQSRKRSSSQSSHSLGSAKVMKTNTNPSAKDRLPFRCSMCAHMFEEPGDLQVHFGEHCPGQVYPFTSSLRMQVMGQGIMQYFPCELCGATYIKPANLQRHLDNHAMNLVPVQGKPYQKNPYMQGLPQPHAINSPIPHGMGGLSCPICGMQFVDPQKLIQHVELHQQQGYLPHPSGYQQQMPFSHSPLSPPYASPGMSHMQMGPNPFTAEAISHRQQTDALSNVLFNEKKSGKRKASNQSPGIPSHSPRSEIPAMQLPVIRNVRSTSSEPQFAPSHYHDIHNQGSNSNSSPAALGQSKESGYEEFNNIRSMLAEPITPITICPRDDYLEDPPLTTNAHQTNKSSASQEPSQENRLQRSDKPQEGGTNLLKRIKSEYAKRDETSKYTASKDQDTASETLACESAQDAMFSDSDDCLPRGDKLAAIKTEKLNEKRNSQAYDRLLQSKKEKLQDMSAKVKQSMAALLAERKKNNDKPISDAEPAKSQQNTETIPKDTALSQMLNCIERLQKEPITNAVNSEADMPVSESGRNLIVQILNESDSVKKSQGDELNQTAEPNAKNVSYHNIDGSLTDGSANTESQEPNISTTKGIVSPEDGAICQTATPTVESEVESGRSDSENLMICNVVSLTDNAESSKQCEPRKEASISDASIANKNAGQVDDIEEATNTGGPACQEADSSIAGIMSNVTEVTSQAGNASNQAALGEVDLEASKKVASGESLFSVTDENHWDAEPEAFSDMDYGGSDGDYDDLDDENISYEPIAVSPASSPSCEESSTAKPLPTGSEAKEIIEEKAAGCLPKDTEGAMQENNICEAANPEKLVEELSSLQAGTQDTSEPVTSEDQTKSTLTKDNITAAKREQEKLMGITVGEAVVGPEERVTSSPNITATVEGMPLKSDPPPLSIGPIEGMSCDEALDSNMVQSASSEQKGSSIVRPWLTADDTISAAKEMVKPDRTASIDPEDVIPGKDVTVDSQHEEKLEEVSETASAEDVVKDQDAKSIELSEVNHDASIQSGVADENKSSGCEITDAAQEKTAESPAADIVNDDIKSGNAADDIIPDNENSPAKSLAANVTMNNTDGVEEGTDTSSIEPDDVLASTEQTANETSYAESAKDTPYVTPEKEVSSICATAYIGNLATSVSCDSHIEESATSSADTAADIALPSPTDDPAVKVTSSLKYVSSEESTGFTQLSAEDDATPEPMSVDDTDKVYSETRKISPETEGTNEVVEQVRSDEIDQLVVPGETVLRASTASSNDMPGSTKDTPVISLDKLGTTDSDKTSSGNVHPMSLSEDNSSPCNFTAVRFSTSSTPEENPVVGSNISKLCFSDNTDNVHSISHGACINTKPTSTQLVERDESQPNEIVCLLCFNGYQSKALYLEHLLTHTKIHCPSCSKTFSEINKLYVHFENVH